MTFSRKMIIFANRNHQNAKAMENKIKKIFTGTLIDANFIGNILEESEIQFLIRNYQEESLAAGWAGGVTENAASVFVLEKDYQQAMKLLDEIKESIIGMDLNEEE